MIALIIAPFYLALNIFFFIQIIKWLRLINRGFDKAIVKILLGTIVLFGALASVFAFFIPPGNLRRIVKLIGNYSLGVELYLLLALVVIFLIRLIFILMLGKQKIHKKGLHIFAGFLVFIFTITVVVYGSINARNVKTTKYTVEINKKCGKTKELNVVLLADLHMGYNIGLKQIEEMASKVNALNPDIVLIAGDVFDNEYEALEKPEKMIAAFKSIKSKYGIFATYGNHDINETILTGFTFDSKENSQKESDPRMDEFMEKAGIEMLQDKSKLIDDSFYLVGRPDAIKPGRGIKNRKTAKEVVKGLNKSKPIILMEHEPVEQKELAKAGVDLDVNGHTHDGQLFPGTIFTNIHWDNAYGYKKYDNMHNIVTSGYGLFGPYMRVGTKTEIVDIKVKFK